MGYIKITIIIFVLLFIGIRCKSKVESLTNEDAKKMSSRIEMMYNDVDAYTAKEILDSAYVLYSPLFPVGLSGIDVLMYNIESNARSFPDFKFKIDSFYVVKNIISAYWTATGKNTGPLGRMPSTGKSIKVSGFAVYKVRDGKIYQMQTFWNVLEYYKQLGFQVIPRKTEK